MMPTMFIPPNSFLLGHCNALIEHVIFSNHHRRRNLKAPSFSDWIADSAFANLHCFAFEPLSPLLTSSLSSANLHSLGLWSVHRVCFGRQWYSLMFTRFTSLRSLGIFFLHSNLLLWDSFLFSVLSICTLVAIYPFGLLLALATKYHQSLFS